MYNRTYWLDHVTNQSGSVIQQGTPIDQARLNNAEVGILDAHMAETITLWANFQLHRDDEGNISTLENDFNTHASAISTLTNRATALETHAESVDAEVLGELHTVTLNNSQKPPFNSTVDSPVSVALTKVRKNLYYSIETEVTAHSGIVGDILVSDKALNGFKVSFTGSGSSTTLTIRIKGGMM